MKCQCGAHFKNNQRTGYQGGNNLSNSNEKSLISIVYKLHQNYPNPFNPTTSISYDLPKNEFVSVNVWTLWAGSEDIGK